MTTTSAAASRRSVNRWIAGIGALPAPTGSVERRTARTRPEPAPPVLGAGTPLRSEGWVMLPYRMATGPA